MDAWEGGGAIDLLASFESAKGRGKDCCCISRDKRGAIDSFILFIIYHVVVACDAIPSPRGRSQMLISFVLRLSCVKNDGRCRSHAYYVCFVSVVHGVGGASRCMLIASTGADPLRRRRSFPPSS